jgi:HD superfamily phosphodiesterase
MFEETGMKIDKGHVKEVFRIYTDSYDITKEKIALKIGHTYRVADLCEQIAQSEGMGSEEQSLAWLLGMLHDIGRFEQLKRYNTFNDAKSIDHALFGTEILFGYEDIPEKEHGAEKGMIRCFIEDTTEDALIKTAIGVHSTYRIPEGLDERTEKFCHILRDGDKIDILRVNIDTPLEEIYNTTREELYHAQVTEAVMKSFYEHHATLRSLKRTPIDNIAGHISLIYELVFPKSIELVKEQGYWEKLIGFPSENPVTVEQLGLLREEMQRFLEERTCNREQVTL